MNSSIDIETQPDFGTKTINQSQGYSPLTSNLLSYLIAVSNKNDGPKMFIKDIKTTHEKLDKLIKGGSNALEIVTDFDHTMSRYCFNGKIAPSCHGIFEMDPELTKATRLKLTDFRNKYYPIEMDPHLSEQDKIPHMLDWWIMSHNILIDCGIHRCALEKTVRDCGLVLRDKVTEFLKLLNTKQVPVLIFSAGLGDVIDLFLRFSNMYYDNMEVVSNFMKFDEFDKLIGFSEPIIHSFNKTTAILSNYSHNDDDGGNRVIMSANRPCTILLGDSTGDVRMVADTTDGVVLRIGFLNSLVDQKRELYQSIYDIVLVNSDTFEIPWQIVQCILNQKMPTKFESHD